MKFHTRLKILTVTVAIAVFCKKADAQLASEKPLSSSYSRLVKEKLAEKQNKKPPVTAVQQNLPSKQAMPKQTIEAMEKRKKKRG